MQLALRLTRHAASATSSGVDPAEAEAARTAVATHVHILTPEQDEELLRAAGFKNVTRSTPASPSAARRPTREGAGQTTSLRPIADGGE